MNQNTNNTQTIENVCEFLNEQMQFFEQTAEVQRAIRETDWECRS